MNTKDEQYSSRMIAQSSPVYISKNNTYYREFQIAYLQSDENVKVYTVSEESKNALGKDAKYELQAYKVILGRTNQISMAIV